MNFHLVLLVLQIGLISSERIEIFMPNVTTTYEDAYMCTSYKLNSNQTYAIDFEALANSSIAHHMLVYACEKPTSFDSLYECAHNECEGSRQIIFAWGRNAPALSMPNDVSFHVGPQFNRSYLVVNFHYLRTVNNDTSGVAISFSNEPRKYEAGILLLVSGYIAIPPHTNQYSSFASCKYLGEKLNVFAYRVHAHQHGVVNSAYRLRNDSWTELARGDPQWPQTFYKTNSLLDIDTNDLLFARCVYQNDLNHTVFAGPTANDEMCNVYLMYYSEKSNQPSICFGNRFSHLYDSIPAQSLKLPPIPDSFNKNDLHSHH